MVRGVTTVLWFFYRSMIDAMDERSPRTSVSRVRPLNMPTTTTTIAFIEGKCVTVGIVTNMRPSIKLEFVGVGFCEGRKTENAKKNPRSKARTNNKLNAHETASTRIEPGTQRWEASAHPLRKQCCGAL